MSTFSIADLARKRRTFRYRDEDGFECDVTYRPHAMTPAREAEIARMAADERDDSEDVDVQQTEQGITKIVLGFCEVVEAMGLEGPLTSRVNPRTGAPEGEEIVAAGELIPIEPEVVRYFSNTFIVGILTAIARDARPKAGRRNNLNDG
jgi:hypothetical protein